MRDARAVSEVSHPLLGYGPIVRLARRYTSLQERSFNAQDHGLESAILERLWFGNPQEGWPSWSLLLERLAALEQALANGALAEVQDSLEDRLALG